MAGDDRTLREALQRAAEPADVEGVFEAVARRRSRFRLRTRLASVALAVAVLVGAGAATWALARTFGLGSGEPATNPPTVAPTPSAVPPSGAPVILPSEEAPSPAPAWPTPSLSPSSEPECLERSVLRGDFDGNGSAVARLSECTGGDARWIIDIDWGGPEGSWQLEECREGCSLLAAPDLNGDGTDELAVVTVGFSIQEVVLYVALPREIGPGTITVAAPGDPAGGFEPGEPARFAFGGDGFTTYNVRCEDGSNGPVLIQTAAESLPHDSPDAVWHVHETELRFSPHTGPNGRFEVVSVDDYTLPTTDPEQRPLFAQHDEFCGAPTAVAKGGPG